MSQYDITKSRVWQWIIIILILSAVAGGYFYLKSKAAQTTVDNISLVGFWSFEDGSGTVATDFSGSGKTGTLTGGPTWVDGKIGKALSFSGSGQYVDMGTSPITGTNAFTLSSWITNQSIIALICGVTEVLRVRWLQCLICNSSH